MAAVAVFPDFAPLFRLYSDVAGQRDHLYTTDPTERTDAESGGYAFERVEGFVSTSPFAGGTPLYRVYKASTNSNFYTTEIADRDAKLAAGYVEKPIAGYVYAAANVAGTVPLVRLNDDGTDHFFLASRHLEYESVLSGVLGGNWQLDDGGPSQSGLAGYISPSGLLNPLGHVRHQARVAGVGSATGAFELALAGIKFHGYGPAVDFRLLYNSQSIAEGPFSPGWGHPFRAFITEGSAVTGEPVVVVTWDNGRETTYIWNAASSSYESDPPDYSALERHLSPSDVNYGYNLTTRDQTTFEFRKFTLTDPVTTPGAPDIRLIGIVDRHSNRVQVNRQASTGRIDWVSDAAGRQLTFQYADVSHPLRLTGLQDSTFARTLAFGYDANGLLDSYTNARAGLTQLAYNTAGLLSTVTYPRGAVGRTLQISYDTEGRVVTSTGSCQQPAMHFSYGGTTTAVPSTMSVLDSANSTVIAAFQNSPSGLCLSQAQDAISPTPATFECADSNHPTLPTRIVDFRGNATDYTYDANGNIDSVTNAEGKTATWSYDLNNNNLLSVTDFGAPTRTTTFGWSPSGLTLETVTDPNNLVKEYDSNPQGQITHVRNPLTHETVYTYDADGNLEQRTDPMANVTQFDHDAAGRQISVTDAENRQTQYAFDANDNVEQVTDDTGHQTNLTYDPNDNLETISYIRSGVQDTVTYSYDGNDCLASVEDPNGGLVIYAYDSEGRVESRTDARSQVTNYTYDANSRLDTITYVGRQESVSFDYDENGNMEEVDESWLTPQTFTYDILNRLESHTNSYGQTVDYTYDDASNLKTVSYQTAAGPKTVTYSYDLGSRLDTVSDWTGGLIDYGYDSASNLKSESHSNGTSTQYDHDLASRLTSITHRKSDNSAFASYVITLDGVGNHESVASVDPLPMPDPPASDTTYSIGPDNRLLSDSAGIIYGHDANGNRSQKSAGGAATTYTYDYEDRLLQSSTTGSTIQHVYDGLGNRIARLENGVETRYVLDLSGSLSRVLAETDSSNVASAHYVHGLELGLAARIRPNDARDVYHYDSRGSTIATSDAAEVLTNRYAYGPFGKLADQQEAFANPFKFVGRLGVMSDVDSMSYMRARFYDADGGRFISKDPQSFGGGDWNLYQYAGSNPVVRVDQTGLRWSPAGVVAGAVMAIGPLTRHYRQQLHYTRLQFGAYSRRDYTSARRYAQLARAHSREVELHLRRVLFTGVRSPKGTKLATRIFGKTGVLRLVDMRYRHGQVIKIQTMLLGREFGSQARERLSDWWRSSQPASD